MGSTIKPAGLFAVVFVIIAAFFLSCIDNTAPAAEPSGLPDLSAAVLNDAEYVAVVAANNAFACDLFRELCTGNENNVFLSPWSIQMSLAMTWAGAAGQTELEMRNAFHCTLEPAQHHAAFRRLRLDIAGHGAAAGEEDVFVFHSINAAWGERTYAFVPAFVDFIDHVYGSPLMREDFISAPEESRVHINQWAHEQTNGKIGDILGPNSINKATRLIIANAVYFDAAWESPFKGYGTYDRRFQTSRGDTCLIPFMHKTGTCAYATGPGWRAIELPYTGGEFSMVIVLPDSGAFASFSRTCTGAMLAEIGNALVPQKGIKIAVPKFQFIYGSFSLKPALQRLGIQRAFVFGQADFTRMGGADLFLWDVVHTAYVAVGEEGTVATAATVSIVANLASPEMIYFTADHPFLFFIRDITSGQVLFIGRFVEPCV